MKFKQWLEDIQNVPQLQIQGNIIISHIFMTDDEKRPLNMVMDIFLEIREILKNFTTPMEMWSESCGQHYMYEWISAHIVQDDSDNEVRQAYNKIKDIITNNFHIGTISQGSVYLNAGSKIIDQMTMKSSGGYIDDLEYYIRNCPHKNYDVDDDDDNDDKGGGGWDFDFEEPPQKPGPAPSREIKSNTPTKRRISQPTVSA